MSFLDWYIVGEILFSFILIMSWSTVKETKFIITVDDVIMFLWLGVFGPLWALVIGWGVYKGYNKWLCIRTINVVKAIRKQLLYTNNPSTIPTLQVDDPQTDDEIFADTELGRTTSYRADERNSIDEK